jgi:hypothetical protein
MVTAYSFLSANEVGSRDLIACISIQSFCLCER